MLAGTSLEGTSLLTRLYVIREGVQLNRRVDYGLTLNQVKQFTTANYFSPLPTTKWYEMKEDVMQSSFAVCY